MKRRGLKVKTGVRAPGIVGLSAWLKPWEDCPCGSEEHQKGGHPSTAPIFWQAPLVPLIRCVVDPPCGHCYYCRARAEAWGIPIVRKTRKELMAMYGQKEKR